MTNPNPPPKTYLVLAATLRLMRDIKGISLRTHATQLGLSPATLSRIERGKGCDLITLVRIRQATGMDYNLLLEGGAAYKMIKL